MKSLQHKNFLTLLDFSPEEINYYVDLAIKLKADKKAGKEKKALTGKNFALIFEKDSTRTRCSFEVGAADQGAFTTYLGPTGSQLSKKESIADTARVLGRIYDAIEYRGFAQETVEELAHYAGVPVWNGLTDADHPTQVLANLMTLKEHFTKPLNELKFAYVGHGQSNMSNALMIGAVKMGMDFTLIGPKKYFPKEDFLAKCEAVAKETGASISLTDDVAEGAKGLDVIYTGVWVTMGDPYDLWADRIKEFLPYQVNMAMLKASGNPDIKFCHCLPSFHDTNTQVGKDIFARFGLDGIEVVNEVFESDYNLSFDEAENRMHTIKALMVATFADYEALP